MRFQCTNIHCHHPHCHYIRLNLHYFSPINHGLNDYFPTANGWRPAFGDAFNPFIYHLELSWLVTNKHFRVPDSCCIIFNLFIDWSFDCHLWFSNTCAYKFCGLFLYSLLSGDWLKPEKTVINFFSSHMPLLRAPSGMGCFVVIGKVSSGKWVVEVRGALMAACWWSPPAHVLVFIYQARLPVNAIYTAKLS